MNDIKILITGTDYIDKLNIAKRIVAMNDNLSITPVFTTDENFNNVNENYKYYLDPSEVNLAFKNNALFYIYTKDYISTGITFDDFYNNDISYVNLVNFNSIPDRFFYEFDILVIWVDTSKQKPSNLEIQEVKFLEERLKNFKYLYFLNESNHNIASTIVEYLNNIEKRQELLEENA